VNNNVYAFDGGSFRLNPADTPRACSINDVGKQPQSLDIESRNIPRPELAKQIYEMRRLREKFLSQDLLAEPGWDILLILYWAGATQQRMTISGACVSAGVPPTTALRWVQRLIETGMVEKEPHPTDHRVSWLTLSKEATDTLDEFLAVVAERGFH
jgi:DNA-binding MarR family transcriptional regulator